MFYRPKFKVTIYLFLITTHSCGKAQAFYEPNWHVLLWFQSRANYQFFRRNISIDGIRSSPTTYPLL